SFVTTCVSARAAHACARHSCFPFAPRAVGARPHAGTAGAGIRACGSPVLSNDPNSKGPTVKARQLAWLLAAATVTLLAACGGGGSNDNLDDRLGIADPKLRLVHAVPGGPDVSLWRNGLKDADATGIAYKTASKYYVINEGRTDLQIKTASGDTAVAAAQ